VGVFCAKTIEEVVPMPVQELHRWRLLLRWLILSGSTLIAIAGSVWFAQSKYDESHATQKRHMNPAKAMQMSHDFTATEEQQQPGSMIATRSRDGQTTVKYVTRDAKPIVWRNHAATTNR